MLRGALLLFISPQQRHRQKINVRHQHQIKLEGHQRMNQRKVTRISVIPLKMVMRLFYPAGECRLTLSLAFLT